MSTLKPLTGRERAGFSKKHPEWKLTKKETEIQRTFLFDDYIAGLVFMARISVHAEVLGHHPDMTLSYGKVKVVLSTHDIKALSKKDVLLAGKIDNLYK